MLLCWGCGATVSFDRKEQKAQAISAWNTRAYDAQITALQAENAALQGNLDEVAMLLKARLWDLEHIEREVNIGGLISTTEKAERILSLVFRAEAEAALEKEGQG